MDRVHDTLDVATLSTEAIYYTPLSNLKRQIRRRLIDT